MMMMNTKTKVTNHLFLLLVLQISIFSNVVFSIGDAYYKKPYKSEYNVRPSTVVHIVVSNDLHGLKKGNAGFVCSHGPKVWRKSQPGDRYVLLRFEHSGVVRYKFINCHVRSSRGFVNIPVNVHPDVSAKCYPSYLCGYSIRKSGVYYKPDKKLFPWQQYPRSAKGRKIPKA